MSEKGPEIVQVIAESLRAYWLACAKEARQQQQDDPKLRERRARKIAENRKHVAMQTIALGYGWRPFEDPMCFRDGCMHFIYVDENGVRSKVRIEPMPSGRTRQFLVHKKS